MEGWDSDGSLSWEEFFGKFQNSLVLGLVIWITVLVEKLTFGEKTDSGMIFAMQFC